MISEVWCHSPTLPFLGLEIKNPDLLCNFKILHTVSSQDFSFIPFSVIFLLNHFQTQFFCEIATFTLHIFSLNLVYHKYMGYLYFQYSCQNGRVISEGMCLIFVCSYVSMMDFLDQFSYFRYFWYFTKHPIF